MKKSLVLAMAMAMGISATAFAANPFSDLPAGHWAYGSVAKLSAAGVVDGYPDGTFKGENLMTRYEMAQIVAKAYAKGAIGSDDKLMAEFADELDNLGVRVAKLEKKSDNVKITGQLRAGYKDYDKGTYKAEGRSRLFVSGAINDDWTYGAMIENTQNFNSNNEENETKFRRAFVTGNLGGAKVTAGRQAFKIGNGYTADLTGDAVKVDFGKVLKGTAFYGRFAGDTDVTKAEKNDVYGLGLSYGISDSLKLNAAYYSVDDNGSANITDRDIYSVGLGFNLAKDLSLNADYMKASDELKGMKDDDGWAATVSYKGAKASKAGSWGLYGSYYDQAGATMIDHLSEGSDFKFNKQGIKGYEVGVGYALAKNIVGEISYYDFETKEGQDDDNTMLWSRVTFSF
ncbi:MAG TPA: S-layer homology domain-containing protein [Candidatus Avacidaminococcus intestinavium]|uniref:S-layer homology domain-containing protein n=1 Tax=Candidatus Avacidaminococcus intestinavium TaxID=2840684 RepID=A0A9D1SL64_9FIRM|nr:S-layer homology domain-containing protein [Candidatus Avacidaminococcus intestinavium]